MKKKGYLIIIACLLICGCRSNKDTITNYQKDIELLEEKILSYEFELDESEEAIKNLERELLTCKATDNETIDGTDIDTENTVNETSSEFTVETVVSYLDGVIYFAESNENIVANYTLNLIGYDSELYDDELTVFDYSEKDDSVVKLILHGNLYNMMLARVEWNDEMTEYSIIETICTHEKIDNSIILFDSRLAGYPFEVLIWEDEDGNQKYLPIIVDGYGFSNIIVICDEYSN